MVLRAPFLVARRQKKSAEISSALATARYSNFIFHSNNEIRSLNTTKKKN